MRKDKDWYDKFITPENLSKYYTGSYAARNDALYDLCSDMLPQESSILDVAAGSSFSAEKFLGNPRVKRYVMNDFTDIVREEATRRIKDSRFSVCGADAERADFAFSEYNVGICVSLEHIENDMDLLDGFAAGTLLILGSPNCDARAHVRFFTNRESFLDRYKGTVSIEGSITSGLGAGKEKYVLCGYKK